MEASNSLNFTSDLELGPHGLFASISPKSNPYLEEKGTEGCLPELVIIWHTHFTYILHTHTHTPSDSSDGIKTQNHQAFF